MKNLYFIGAVSSVFFVCLWPMGGYLGVNASSGIHMFDLSIFSVAIIALMFFLSWIVSQLSTRHTFTSACIFVSGSLTILINYRLINSLLNMAGLGFLVRNSLYVVIAVTIIALFWRFAKKHALSHFLAVFVGVSCVSALFNGFSQVNKFAMYKASHKQVALKQEQQIKLPNIYWIILDSYPSNKAFVDFLGYDNSSFTDFLRNNDFYVADQARSNYNWTVLSLSAALKMDYLSMRELGKEESELDQNAPQTMDILLRMPQFVDSIRAYGYKIMQLDSMIRCSVIVDSCLRDKNNYLDSPGTYFLYTTPISSLGWRLLPKLFPMMLGTEVLNAHFHAKQIDDIPLFLIAHTWGLHPPSTRNADCSMKNFDFNSTPLSSLYSWDGSKIASGQDNIISQLKCVNASAMQLITSLISKDPEALIILEGDHGLRPGKNPDFVDKNDDNLVRAHFEILNSFRFPKHCQNLLYPGISPVNNLRAAKACIEHSTSPFRQDKMILSSEEIP